MRIKNIKRNSFTENLIIREVDKYQAIEPSSFSHIELRPSNQKALENKEIIKNEKSDIGHIKKTKNKVHIIRKEIEYCDDYVKEVMVSVYSRLFKNSGAYFAQNKMMSRKTLKKGRVNYVLSKRINNYVDIGTIIASTFQLKLNEIRRYDYKFEHLETLFNPGQVISYKNKEYTIDFDSLAIVMMFIMVTQDIDGIGYGLLNMGFVPCDETMTLKAAKIDYGYALPMEYDFDNKLLYETSATNLIMPYYSNYLKLMGSWVSKTDKGNLIFNEKGNFPQMLHVDYNDNDCITGESINQIVYSDRHLNLLKLISNIPSKSIRNAISYFEAIEQDHINLLHRSIKEHFTNEKITHKAEMIETLEVFTKLFSHNVACLKHHLKSVVSNDSDLSIKTEERRKTLDLTNMTVKKLCYRSKHCKNSPEKFNHFDKAKSKILKK
ncbi:MAG: hypothetical protein J0G32_05840 [Alphaproteobacteria bacterium]|nr:hypothetical protein [Alphaproteobacteria bacterium]OJV15772.1 MAG: hypothetical protein BGO27_07645 [Alphaproteobacteria bacterium 33-17]